MCKSIESATCAHANEVVDVLAVHEVVRQIASEHRAQPVRVVLVLVLVAHAGPDAAQEAAARARPAAGPSARASHVGTAAAGLSPLQRWRPHLHVHRQLSGPDRRGHVVYFAPRQRVLFSHRLVERAGAHLQLKKDMKVCLQNNRELMEIGSGRGRGRGRGARGAYEGAVGLAVLVEELAEHALVLALVVRLVKHEHVARALAVLLVRHRHAQAHLSAAAATTTSATTSRLAARARASGRRCLGGHARLRVRPGVVEALTDGGEDDRLLRCTAARRPRAEPCAAITCHCQCQCKSPLPMPMRAYTELFNFS